MKILILAIAVIALATGCSSLSENQVKDVKQDYFEKIANFKASEPVVNRYIEDVL